MVRSARAFEWLARWRSRASELRAGEYELSRGLSAERVLATIDGVRSAGEICHELAGEYEPAATLDLLRILAEFCVEKEMMPRPYFWLYLCCH